MHIAPAEFRSVRTGEMTVRFAILSDIAYVLADLPNGSAGTSVEDPCERQHWAFVTDGAIELVIGERREAIAAGTAFHIKAGVSHRIFATGPTRLAGFQPIEPGRDLSDDGLRAAGFQVLPLAPDIPADQSVPAVAPPDGRIPPTGGIVTSAKQMGELLFTRATLGRRSGYTSAWCDMPHWGLIADGALAIEWEDDVEVLTAGDVYYCPPGPPAHRLQTAEGATVIDFTPVEAFRPGVRVATWRQEFAASLRRRRRRNGDPLETASLG
jgi:mannose-6-phosphate isomerase-like protein (cupin superfamily)